MDTYNVIGIMSGTSLDGLDICYCSFFLSKNNKWNFNINYATTVSYSSFLTAKLSNAKVLNGLDLMFLHNDLGNFIGKEINKFIKLHHINKKEINFVASHGHTVFHQPQKHLTTQIGNGANITAITQLPVVCDFRSTDVALGGQGAPLVPIGDKLLFSEYDYCINLGGIANVSYQKNKERIAFDVCPVNIVLNKLAQNLGFNYDEEGKIAVSGAIDIELLNQLNKVDYYKQSYPKSLGIEEITKHFFPILDNNKIATEDKLATFVAHISLKISNVITTKKNNILFTGGGTFNTFLMQQIQANTNNKIIIPTKEIINFKEALIFAFLGVLRWRKEANCLQSVTGAKQNNIGGGIYYPF